MSIVPGIDISTEQIADLCRRYQVREMALFGSAAREELRPDSDIDVLVELQPDHHLGLFEFDDLLEERTKASGPPLGAARRQDHLCGVIGRCPMT